MKHSCSTEGYDYRWRKTGITRLGYLNNMFVKIIEKDKARCHYLANKLENVMVLNGDGFNVWSQLKKIAMKWMLL